MIHRIPHWFRRLSVWWRVTIDQPCRDGWNTLDEAITEAAIPAPTTALLDFSVWLWGKWMAVYLYLVALDRRIGDAVFGPLGEDDA